MRQDPWWVDCCNIQDASLKNEGVDQIRSVFGWLHCDPPRPERCAEDTCRRSCSSRRLARASGWNADMVYVATSYKLIKSVKPAASLPWLRVRSCSCHNSQVTSPKDKRSPKDPVTAKWMLNDDVQWCTSHSQAAVPTHHERWHFRSSPVPTMINEADLR